MKVKTLIYCKYNISFCFNQSHFTFDWACMGILDVYFGGGEGVTHAYKKIFEKTNLNFVNSLFLFLDERLQLILSYFLNTTEIMQKNNTEVPIEDNTGLETHMSSQMSLDESLTSSKEVKSQNVLPVLAKHLNAF